MQDALPILSSARPILPEILAMGYLNLNPQACPTRLYALNHFTSSYMNFDFKVFISVQKTGGDHPHREDKWRMCNLSNSLKSVLNFSLNTAAGSLS